MQSDDPGIASKLLHGQVVYFPTGDAWVEILADKALSGLPIAIPEFASAWLDEYAKFEAAHLGLVRNPRRESWSLLPLLLLDGHYYRVHFENVICHSCQRRCGPSAKPETVAYAGTAIESTKDAWAEFDRLPLQSCPHCHEVLRHRQTVWLAYPDAA